MFDTQMVFLKEFIKIPQATKKHTKIFQGPIGHSDGIPERIFQKC